ncbi:hypothetical protein VTK56DRAFT_8630 [Thermocarpiscus australiensis]
MYLYVAAPARARRRPATNPQSMRRRFKPHHLSGPKMDSLQLKVDSISGELSLISDALRGYLDHGIASNRKVQPPRTKAGRDLLQHLLGRLNQVSTGLVDVRNLAAVHTSPSPAPAPAPSPSPSQPAPRAPDTLLLCKPATALPILRPPEQVELQKPHCSECDGAGTSRDLPEAALRGTEPRSDLPMLSHAAHYEIRLKDGSVYHSPVLSEHASPLFDCTYQDIHILNEELFELYSSHPVVRDRGYFKLQVRGLPPLNVQKVARPSKDHATSFCYKTDRLGLVKVDTGKRFKLNTPSLPLPPSSKMHWSLAEQQDLWNSAAADPPKGSQPYIIGNPLFDDVELSPGQKLRRRGRTALEGINTQYVYFNLTGLTITTMHREDAHVRSENLLRSGQHKFWCFVKPAFAKKLEERMALEYPEMRRCSQAVRHLSRHIPPAKLDEWGIEYTLDYCVPGQAVVTEPGTYHQVLNLGPNYAVAINLEYNSSPDMPQDYQFCDRLCPDKFAISAEDFRIYDKAQSPEEKLPRTPETAGSQERHEPVSALGEAAPLRSEPPTVSPLTQSATPPPERGVADHRETAESQLARSQVLSSQSMPYQPAQEAFTYTISRVSVLPPRPQDGVVQPGPLESPPMAPAIPTPEGSLRSEPGSVEQINQFPQLPDRSEVLEPPKQPPAQVGPPALQSFPEGLQLASNPLVQRSDPPPQTQTPCPDAVALFLPAVQQASSLVGHHNMHDYSESRTEEVEPIRKTARLVNPKRQAETPPPEPSKRQRVEAPPVQGSPASSAFEHLATLIRGRETAQMGGLAPEKLCGKPAFERLAHLVREWRRYTKSAPIIYGGLNLIKTVEETMHEYPELHIFLSRLFKMKLAESVERAVGPSGQPPALQDVMNGMLKRLGWDESKRHKLHDYLREGKCWRTICGSYDGLLCLIPPDADCLDLALFKDQLARFHSELDNDFVRKLCAMGNLLQKSIWDYLELPEFIWETTTTTWLSADQLSPLLAPFRLIKSNYFDPNSGYYWPKPAGWQWDWPTDPTSVIPGDQPCALCPSRRPCRCIETKVPRVPRISTDGSKGPGVRAVGPHRANDILGELVGELVPVGTHAADWTMELRRPDLDDQPVAEIYPRRMGNWVRKVNHSTNPSAAFRVVKISGRWRLMLVAARDVADGEEITAKYGRGFLRGLPYDVVEGLH